MKFDKSKIFSRKVLVIGLLLLIYFVIADLNHLFADSKIVPEGYENSTIPMQLFMLDLTMYLNYCLLALVIVFLVPKADLLLYIVSLGHLFLWIMELVDFIVYRNEAIQIFKDYAVLLVFIIVLVKGVYSWLRNKGKETEIINVTNLALVKWFIPKSEAEMALKNSQRNMELEHKLLRSQMNPHFIFNSLTSIQNYIYKENAELAGAYLGKFAKLMRLILENSRHEFISFRKEIETLELYLELQKMRFGNKFKYQILVDPEIDQEEVLIPPMVAQPFIENSLEHGILHKSAEGFISISFSLNKQEIKYEVTDNGVGREMAGNLKREQNFQHQSFATRITQERLSLIKDSKNSSHLIEVEDLFNEDRVACGTKTSFSIPYSAF